jgi:hypothetical protein
MGRDRQLTSCRHIASILVVSGVGEIQMTTPRVTLGPVGLRTSITRAIGQRMLAPPIKSSRGRGVAIWRGGGFAGALAAIGEEFGQAKLP